MSATAKGAKDFYPIRPVELYQPATAAEWLASPMTSKRARALLARPEAIRDVIDAVKRALESMQQTLIERENEGVKS